LDLLLILRYAAAPNLRKDPAAMCPFCKEHDGKPCTVSELPNGRLIDSCGRHSWPNSGAFLESCRLASLTMTRTVHTWTQGY